MQAGKFHRLPFACQNSLALQKVIASFPARELRLIEQWGSGVRNILRGAARLQLPEPSLTGKHLSPPTVNEVEPLVQEIGMRVRFRVYLGKPHTLEKQKIGSRTSVAIM